MSLARSATGERLAAGAGVRRLFLGPFVPSPLLRPALIPVVPEHPRFRFQALLSLKREVSEDVDRAVSAIVADVRARGDAAR